MNLLITGGAGFIGSNLCDFLLREGNKVVVIDNLSTGNLSNLSNSIDSIDFYQEDIESFDLTKFDNFDAVVHLAAQASVPLSVSNFKVSSISNIVASINVIDYCSKEKIPLIYASSSAIYGSLELGDDNESEIDLLSPYGVDKYSMEMYAKISHNLYQLSSIGLRFFNVYGPRQDPSSPYSGVISIFTDKLSRSESIIINGGYQTRDFIYVDDVVKSIYKSIVISKNAVICEQVNILTGASISIDLLADKLMKQMGSYVEKIYCDLPIDDPKVSNGTTIKMVNFLKLSLSELTLLDTGLQKTINYIKRDKLEFKK
ncbi:NAD-dependent epimerase/dehydratase family protein [Candidatus Pseudothioglobus singularis]|nr:NAD-dependent epimerase/dehydratase family protein [Candidatus Pseudothioglobus singularis]